MSTNLRDVEISMNGETIQEQLENSESIPTGQVNNEFVIFKLANPNKDGGIHIMGIDYIIDPRTITKEKPHGNGPEMIRLVSGVPTIWAKEQKDIDANYIKKNIRTISFPRGSRFITIPTWDKTLLEFMRASRHHIKSLHRKTGTKTEYVEYDPNEQAKALLEKENQEIKAIVTASERPIEKIKPHAFYLGINFNDEYGIPKPDSRLKADYIVAAKRDPKRFNETLESEEVEIQYLIRSAIIDGKIDISKGDGYSYWAGGSRICLLPKGEKPMKVLTELAVTKNKEGREFKERLKKIVT